MTRTATIAPLAVAILVFGGTIFLVPFQANPNAMAADSGMMTGGPRLAMGHIGSVQLGSDGQAGWLQSGIWVLRVHASAEGQSPTAQLIARFEMLKPDGTAMHVHKIYNFKASEMTQEGNSTNVLKGTATVTMKDGPVSDVPLTVKVFNNAVVGFWIGPEKVDGHFGTGPVYGILSANSRAVMQDIHSMMQGMAGTGSMGSNQPNVIKMSAKEVDDVYRWSTSDGINPTLKLVSNTNNTIQIQNPTDEKHELVIESGDTEVASSGDIAPDSSGQLTFKPTMNGTFEYHCEYHPDTMKGTIQLISQ
jgi:cupredoxin-like protein